MDIGKKYQLRRALRHDDEVRGITICGNNGGIVTSTLTNRLGFGFQMTENLLQVQVTLL
jgi:hypothetical protein